MCLIPEADKAHLRFLAGEPTMNGIVQTASPRDVAGLMAVLLSGLSPADRRDALRMASAQTSGPRKDVVPISALMPENASIEQLRAMWNGLALLLLSLGSASSDTSVGSVVANASSMASGVPFASDPMVGERQNEVLLAKAILEAALLGDEEAKSWFKDNQLGPALERVAAYSAGGSSDADPRVISAMEKIGSLYDCMMHEEPLGGDIMNGGAISDFLKDSFGGLKKAVSQSVKDAASDLSAGVDKSLKIDDRSNTADGAEDMRSIRPINRVLSAEPDRDVASKVVASRASTGESEHATPTNNAVNALSDSIAEAKEALDAAKAAMGASRESMAGYQTKLKNAALQSAKLQWAQQILEAPEEVAAILAATSPNMSDAGTFLQSMLATLPAAKSTGSLGTLKALVYALRSATSSGQSAGQSLYDLISGDPETVAMAEQMPSFLSRIEAQKDVVRNLLSESLDTGSMDEEASAQADVIPSGAADAAPSTGDDDERALEVITQAEEAESDSDDMPSEGADFEA